MVLQDEYCEKCGEKYTNTFYRWCKPCQINDLKITNQFSGNEQIDNLIQEMQLKIQCDDMMFEWIPYNQFVNLKKISKNGFNKIYSTIWKDGSLYYNINKHEYTRSQSKKVYLKYNLQYNDINEV